MNYQTFTGREPHPILPMLTEEEEGKLHALGKSDAVEELYRTRKRTLELVNFDPLRYGYVTKNWVKVNEQIEQLRKEFPVGVIEVVGLGGNRSSKTYGAGRKMMQIMCDTPGARVWCLQTTEATSRADQQGVIFDHIPPEWRPSDTGKNRRGRTTKIVYSVASGFSENTFVLPNGSQCWFKFYGADVKTVEGAELNACWADELITPEWIEALRFRLVTRNGLLLLTFTPADGYSATVREYLDGARTVEEETAELLPPPDNVVPRVQKCTGERTYKARVVYFHTKDNPFGNYEAMKMELARSSRDRILTRAYGVATKAVNSQFLFKDTVHVLSLNRWMEFQKKYPNMTRYQLVDPCSGRPWYAGWFACPYPKKVIMYREWPSTGHRGAYIEGIGDPGPWAVPGNAFDGARGPAQKPMNFGLQRYKDEFLKAENGEEIFERWMDSRYGNSAKTEEEGTTTLIQQMQALGMEFIAMTSEKKILGTPDGSIDMINSALYYDQETKIGEYSSAPGMNRINEPELLVLETCPNAIWALQNWTGKDGQEGACKDPIDLFRGFYLSDLGHISAESMEVHVAGGSY